MTAAGTVQAEAQPAVAPEMVARRHLRQYQALFAAAAVAFLALAMVHLRQPAHETPLRRFAITPAVDVPTSSTEAGVAVSPNGRHIAYTEAGTAGKLWIRDLDQSQPRVLEGTDGAFLPFWSPDSAFVGFATGGELMKVSVAGGIPIRLCPLPSSIFVGGSWSPDGQSIVFSSGNYEIYEVPARGGAANLVIAKEQPDATEGGPTGFLGRPHFLPAGAGTRALVYSFGGTAGRTLMVQDLDGGRREILGTGTHPFYSSSGYLIYQPSLDTDELWALPFSLSSLSAAGEAFPITQNGYGPTVAADQTLVYLDRSGQQQRQLVWLDRAGEKIGEIGSPLDSRDPALSPDGRKVAVVTLEGGDRDVWIWEISRGVKNRLTFSEAPNVAPTAPVSRNPWQPVRLARSPPTGPGTADIFFMGYSIRISGLTSGIWSATGKAATGSRTPICKPLMGNTLRSSPLTAIFWFTGPTSPVGTKSM